MALLLFNYTLFHMLNFQNNSITLHLIRSNLIFLVTIHLIHGYCMPISLPTVMLTHTANTASVGKEDLFCNNLGEVFIYKTKETFESSSRYLTAIHCPRAEEHHDIHCTHCTQTHGSSAGSIIMSVVKEKWFCCCSFVSHQGGWVSEGMSFPSSHYQMLCPP